MGLNINALSIQSGGSGGGGSPITASGTASVNDVITGSNLTSVLNISTTAAPANTQGISNIINATGSTGLQSYFPTGPVIENTSQVLQITGLGSAVGATLAIQVNQASGSTSGYLSSTDWTTFNNKENAFTQSDISTSTTGVTIGNGISTIIGISAVTVDIQTANTSQPGLLSSTDWNTFNNKQTALSIGPFSNTSYLNGATLFGPTFQLGAADFNNPGGINIIGQTFAGDKTFTGVLAAPNGTASAVGFHLGTDVGTGFFRSAIDQLSMSAAGATIATWGTAGLKLYNLTASQAVVSDVNKVLTSLAYGSTNINSTLMVRDSSGRSQVTDPVMPQDISTKVYVDTVASSLNPLQATYAASTADIPGTYLNGVGGVGAIFTITATGTFTVDGVTPPAGSRFLLKDQSTGFQNGVYDVTNAGSVGVSPVLTRSLDYNTPTSINAGDLIPVINGTLNNTTSWLQTATVTTVGTDALVFVEWTANPNSYLLKANNLSDVTTPNTALNNILPTQTSNSGKFLTTNGTDSSWASVSAGGSPNLGSVIENLGLAVTMAANAVTIDLKDASGANPSGGSPVNVGFRDSTLTTGQYSIVSTTGALSTVISSGATAGTVSGGLSRIYIYLINNAGTAELAWTSVNLYNENNVISTVTSGGSSNSSSVVYSTTGRSNVAFRYIGYFESTQTTAGTWAAAASTIGIYPFNAIKDYAVYQYDTSNGYGSTNTTVRKFTNQTRATDLNNLLTVSNSSTNGFSVTPNRRCRITISWCDQANAAMDFGITKNCSQLTTNIGSISNSGQRLIMAVTVTNNDASVSITDLALPGDTYRPQTDASGAGPNTNRVDIYITAEEI